MRANRKIYKELGIDGRTQAARYVRPKPRKKKKTREEKLAARRRGLKRKKEFWKNWHKAHRKYTKDKLLTPVHYEMLRKYRSFATFELDPKTVYHGLKAEEKKYVKNLVLGGLPVRDALMDAYMTNDPQKIKSLARYVQGSLIRSAISEALVGADVTKEFLAGKLKQGLDARKTYLNKETGELEESEHADFATQHKYIETTLKLMGAYDKEGDPEMIDPEMDAEVRRIEEAELEDLKAQLDSQKQGG